MDKKHFKAGIASLAGAYNAVFRAKQRASRVVILCYHSVHPGKIFASAMPSEFEEHLQWLKANCEVIRFSDALQIAKQNTQPRGGPAVALTFDDGYADNYEYALPLLVKHGLSATFFVTAGLLENDPAVVERLQRLRKTAYEDIRPLTWDQVKEMKRQGMDIGSHTYSHPNLATLSADKAKRELRASKEIIETRIGEPVTLFAYPFGMRGRHFSSDTMRFVAEAGYQHAAAIAFRPVTYRDVEMALPRFFVTKDNVETLSAKVNGAWDFLACWHEKAPLWLVRILSPESLSN